jgi:hypothetical protein
MWEHVSNIRCCRKVRMGTSETRCRPVPGTWSFNIHCVTSTDNVGVAGKIFAAPFSTLISSSEVAVLQLM